VTDAAARVPGVSSSCGICSGGSVVGAIELNGLGKLEPRRMFSMSASSPGGRGKKESRLFSMTELWIWSSSTAHGLCEKTRPRYHAPASMPMTPNAAPRIESMEASAVRRLRLRIRKPMVVPKP